MASLRIDPLEVEKVSDLVREWEEDVDFGNHWEPEEDEREDWNVYLNFVPGSYYMCDNGHKETIDRDSDLVQRCIQNGETAINIRWEDCPKCHEEDLDHEKKGGSFFECDNWHTGRIERDSDFERKYVTIGHEWVRIPSEDCPKCQEEEKRRERDYYAHDMDMIYGPYQRSASVDL